MLSNLSRWLVFYLLAALAAFLVLVSLSRNSLQVYDQPKGEAVHVGRVTLAKDGFVLVTSFVDTLNPAGVFLGSSELLPAGIYKDFNVPLSQEAAQFDKVMVFLYSDNGDGFLSAEPGGSAADEPLRGLNGAIVKKLIRIY